MPIFLLEDFADVVTIEWLNKVFVNKLPQCFDEFMQKNMFSLIVSLHLSYSEFWKTKENYFHVFRFCANVEAVWN